MNESDLDALTRLVIVSTILFKGQWKLPFPACDTFRAKFNAQNDTDFMRVKAKGAFGASKSDDLTLCTIPYAANNLTMTILMPQNLSEFEEHMSREGLAELFSRIRLQRGDVTLSMPKFKMEKRLNLKKTFCQLGTF